MLVRWHSWIPLWWQQQRPPLAWGLTVMRINRFLDFIVWTDIELEEIQHPPILAPTLWLTGINQGENLCRNQSSSQTVNQHLMTCRQMPWLSATGSQGCNSKTNPLKPKEQQQHWAKSAAWYKSTEKQVLILETSRRSQLRQSSNRT